MCQDQLTLLHDNLGHYKLCIHPFPELTLPALFILGHSSFLAFLRRVLPFLHLARRFCAYASRFAVFFACLGFSMMCPLLSATR